MNLKVVVSHPSVKFDAIFLTSPKMVFAQGQIGANKLLETLLDELMVLGFRSEQSRHVARLFNNTPFSLVSRFHHKYRDNNDGVAGMI